MKNYADKLKDPRWQKRRLEVFQRDGFKCTQCGNDKNTLHVHHEKYTGDPWEVGLEFLKTLCEGCHRKEHVLELKIELPPITAKEWRKDPIVIFENWLIDQYNPKTDDHITPAVKHNFISLMHWLENSNDTAFLQQAKNDFSNYCFLSKIILVCVNGDVYGEKETVVRYGQ